MKAYSNAAHVPPVTQCEGIHPDLGRRTMRVWTMVAVAAGLSLGAVVGVEAQAAGTPAKATGRTFTRPPVGSTWRVDPTHSEVSFRIRHLAGRVRGFFTAWEGTIVTRGEDWSRGTVNVVVRTASIDTRNATRDADLRSSRFFAVDSYPTMTFESTGLVAEGNSFEMSGLLTVKGVTRPVVFKGEYLGIQRDQNGKERIAFDGTALINRRDFGLTWNQVLESGQLLSEHVELEIAIEAVAQ